MDYLAKVERFLKKYHMHYSEIDLAESVNSFIREMEAGLAGLESTLRMIPTYISLDNVTVNGNRVIVMDAGGTNFRVALVSFDKNGNPAIEYMQKYPMMGTLKPLTKDEFFNQIVDYLRLIINESDHIGFCFSFPTEILPTKDGKLLHFDKEVRVSEANGMLIGKNLLDTMGKRGFNADKNFVLINDTVAVLLGAKALNANRTYGSYIGFVLGTGTNTCYIEQNKNIIKSRHIAETPGTQIINTESGGYGKAPRSDFDYIIDAESELPNTQLLEKMISGAYVGKLLLTVLKQAAEDNLLSEMARDNIRQIPDLTPKEIGDFIENRYGDNKIAKSLFDENDRMTVYAIIDAFYERVARLVAVNLAAVMLKTGKGNRPDFPICVSADGTTFYYSQLLRPKLDRYVKDFINGSLGIYCEFVKAENATILGTAVAAL